MGPYTIGTHIGIHLDFYVKPYGKIGTRNGIGTMWEQYMGTYMR